MVGLKVDSVESKWMVSVLVEPVVVEPVVSEPVVDFELKLVVAESVDVESTIEDAGRESRTGCPIVDSTVQSLVGAHLSGPESELGTDPVVDN